MPLSSGRFSPHPKGVKRLAVLLLLLSSSAGAQQYRAAAVGVPFVPAYLGSVALSLSADPFYASRLLNAFGAELARVTAAPTPLSAAEGLKARIAGPAALALPQVAKELGAKVLEPERAAAVLAANALARPDQFQEVVTGLSELKPGLGERVVESLREAPPARGGSPQVLGRLRELGRSVVPSPAGDYYDSSGHLRRFFDGR